MAKKQLTSSMNSLPSYDAAYSFTRPNGYPLDRTGFYEDIATLQSYANSDKAYVGQIINLTKDSDSIPYYINGKGNNNYTQILTASKVGTGLAINNGVLSATYSYTLPVATKGTATTGTLGGIIVGNGLNVDGAGVLSATVTSQYNLPPATTGTLGGIIVGNGLSVTTAGVLSASNIQFKGSLSANGTKYWYAPNGSSVYGVIWSRFELPTTKETSKYNSSHDNYLFAIDANGGFFTGTRLNQNKEITDITWKKQAVEGELVIGGNKYTLQFGGTPSAGTVTFLLADATATSAD